MSGESKGVTSLIMELTHRSRASGKNSKETLRKIMAVTLFTEAFKWKSRIMKITAFNSNIPEVGEIRI